MQLFKKKNTVQVDGPAVVVGLPELKEPDSPSDSDLLELIMANPELALKHIFGEESEKVQKIRELISRGCSC